MNNRKRFNEIVRRIRRSQTDPAVIVSAWDCIYVLAAIERDPLTRPVRAAKARKLRLEIIQNSDSYEAVKA